MVASGQGVGYRLRNATAGILVLAAFWLFVAPPPPLVGTPAYLIVWFGLALGIGAMLGRWWSLLFATLPLVTIPTVLWLNLRTGRIVFIDGEAARFTVFQLTLVGLAGLALGALFGWRRPKPKRR